LENGVMNPTEARIGDMVLRIQTDFLDNPTLCLTLPRAQTRYGWDQGTCAGVLDALVDASVLTRRAGTYGRHFPRLAGQRAA
jgi:hypothetical protein